jgi:hypothetical protein
LIYKNTEINIVGYIFGDGMLYGEEIKDISQKCLIAFYAKREILQIS